MSTKVLLTMQPSTASSNSAIFRGKLLSTVSHSFPFSIPLKDSTFGKRVSGECERGTQECVRHKWVQYLAHLLIFPEESIQLGERRATVQFRETPVLGN